MAESKKLSLFTAILININIMLGAGIFINTAELAKRVGSLSPLVYAVVAILILPLILAIAEIWRQNKGACTFYHFGLPISPFFGFLSSWAYFIGKLCSFALGIHVCVSFLRLIIPVLQIIPILLFDSIIIFLFTLLNLLNVKTGKSVQFTFIGLKLIPIIFAILVGLFLFSGSNFGGEVIWQNFPSCIPLVLYAFAGFEASCSLSQQIENSEKNGPKAILISYGIVVSLVILFQFMFYGSLGSILGSLPQGYLEAYPSLLNKLFSDNAQLKNMLITILHIGIASSSLGSSYGIMFSNSWNLYTLAQNKHTFGEKIFTYLNKYSAPLFCVITEGILGITYLLLTQGKQVPLQQVGALGSAIAYTFSIISLFVITYRQHGVIKLLPTLGLCSCLILIASFVLAIMRDGVSSLLILFLLILIFGTYMFYKKHEPRDLEVYEKL